MNRPLGAAGLIFAIVGVVAYLCRAAQLKKKPDLATAIHIAIGAAAIPASIRMIGFPFTDDFQKLIAAETSWWSLSGEDSLFIVFGALAMAWVSIQAIWAGFSKLKQ